MAISSQRITVSTTAVALNTASTSGQKLKIKNTSANAADLGAAGVTAGTGLDPAAGGAGDGRPQPNDRVFAPPSAAGRPPPPPGRGWNNASAPPRTRAEGAGGLA